MQIECYEFKVNTEIEEAEDKERSELLRELEFKTEQESDAIPFPEIEKPELRVWNELFTRKVSWDEFKGYIPTPILRLIKIHKDKFKVIQIWTYGIDDPLLIGKSDKSDTLFLMGRWGNALEKFEVLREKAIESWKAKRKTKLNQKLASLDDEAIEHFGGGWVSDIY